MFVAGGSALLGFGPAVMYFRGPVTPIYLGRGISMSNELFDFSVTVFLRGHGILAELLNKAEAYAAERKIAPAVLLTARLFPDMFPLTGQVQSACDTAKRTVARLVGVEPPRYEDNEASFEELRARIQKTSAYVESHPVDAFHSASERTIEMKLGSETVSLTARQYLMRFALPNFYFHITTAYDILRHNGVVLGKRDFLGTMSSP
jgi:hypothetical protein